MNNDVYERLADRFPADAHKTRKQGSSDLVYVTGEMVIERLNLVLGFDGWSFEVKAVTVLEDEVWASGRLTVYTTDRTIVREQTGGQIINRMRGTPPVLAQAAEGDRPAVEARPAVKGSIIEIANDIKGAITDCLKKCATLIGVGAYLYDGDERREVQAEMRAQSRGGNKPTAGPPATTDDAPKPMKTKAQLVDDLNRGIAMAKTLGLDPADVDATTMDRVSIQEVISALAKQIKIVKAATAEAAS